MGKGVLPYPAPRQPDFPATATSIDQLMPNARKAVEKTAGRGRLGLAKPDDKVLIVTSPTQEDLAVEAILAAFKEKGIEADVVSEYELTGIPREKAPLISAEEGWLELNWRAETSKILNLERPLRIDGRYDLADYLDCHPKYTAVFAGTGGDSFWRIAMGPKHAQKHKSAFMFDTCEHLLSRLEDLPSDVFKLIEQKTVAMLDRVSSVHITDPQGTDVSFSVTPEVAAVWKAVHPTSGHLCFYPAMSFSLMAANPVLAPLKEKFAGQGITGHRVFCKAEGVIAGTSNHTGYFPHMKTYLKEGQVYKIEGGGKFGDLLREYMDRTKKIHYPGYPKPGALYLWEIALGTAPKFFRRRADLFGAPILFTNKYERNRSGVFHWGIGVDDFDPEVIKYAKENKVSHLHVGHAGHTYFNTFEVTMRDTGERVKIIDKGRLAALDDPEVRSMAERYGDPDDLLAEEWIPAIPGINYPGDYMRDYGEDPVTWIKKEIDGELPATVGVP